MWWLMVLKQWWEFKSLWIIMIGFISANQMICNWFLLKLTVYFCLSPRICLELSYAFLLHYCVFFDDDIWVKWKIDEITHVFLLVSSMDISLQSPNLSSLNSLCHSLKHLALQNFVWWGSPFYLVFLHEVILGFDSNLQPLTSKLGNSC